MLAGGWRTCPVPTKLGYPLIMRQLSRRQYVRDTNESVAVHMMADDFTGEFDFEIQTCIYTGACVCVCVCVLES